MHIFLRIKTSIYLSDTQWQDSLKTNFLCTMPLIKVLPLSDMQHYKH